MSLSESTEVVVLGEIPDVHERPPTHLRVWPPRPEGRHPKLPPSPLGSLAAAGLVSRRAGSRDIPSETMRSFWVEMESVNARAWGLAAANLQAHAVAMRCNLQLLAEAYASAERTAA